MIDKTAYAALAAKGDGVLVKRGSVWTYPTAETDGSGTNIKLPVEYVTDQEVQQALRDGALVPATTETTGAPLSVRIKTDDAPAAISVAQAGTPEAGTDLPPNSRPSHDAGMKSVSREGIERSTAAQTKAFKAEGAEFRHANGGKAR